MGAMREKIPGVLSSLLRQEERELAFGHFGHFVLSRPLPELSNFVSPPAAVLKDFLLD
jgi:hypothetical protein